MQKIVREISLEDFNRQVKHRMYHEYFTAREIELFAGKKNKASLAARYLVKRILIEHAGVAGLGFADLEILKNESGRPKLHTEKINRELLEKIHISMSHTKHTAIALVVIDQP